MSAPPPPPPHGEVPKSSGLPPGKYDIFVIPEHSAGSGFLYLPSLQPNVNSFAAGFASALILVALFQSMAPAFRAWWESFQGLGNMGITLLIFGVGFGAWALGRTQKDGPSSNYRPGPSSGGAGQGDGFGGGSTSSGPPPHAGAPPPPPHSSGPPPPPPPTGGAPPPPQQEKPKPSWQRPPPQPGTSRAETPKGSWEKAREETRKKEEERKTKEAEQKRREEAARRLAELRAKEAKERLQREKEKEAKEKEAKEQKERELAEQRRKDALEKLQREKREREAKEKETKEREAKEREARLHEEQKKKEATPTSRVGSSYAYSGGGEKTSMWPNGRPAASPSEAGSASKNAGSPDKRPPPPTARTCVTDEDAYSFRPYDKPKPRRRPSITSVGESESSWAPSHTTARTSPPPSVRGPYSTKDPDKIVIEAVYLFMNQFAKTPASQLLSGVGSVTDGLILRITTEGLFIDDDVRGVPQREWDVKAWTLKLVETGEWKAKGLHVLRATVRDQEGKRYIFVLDETEAWKVAVGLQRLRRGTQVRQLGVSGMSPSEARGTLEMLGWSG